METTSMHIKKHNGKWTINGKNLSEMNALERKFLEDFFREVKIKDGQILMNKKNFL